MTNNRPVRKLTPDQRRVTTWSSGPLLVTGGPGVGKTFTLSACVASLLRQDVDPSSILVLALTLREAREITENAASRYSPRCSKVKSGTFLSWTRSVLRRHADLVGLPEKFTLLAPADVADVMQELRVARKLHRGGRGFSRKQILAHIYSYSRNHCVPVKRAVRERYADLLGEVPVIEALFKDYETHKKQHHLRDQEDLLTSVRWLLESQPLHDTAQPVRRPKYVLVDDLHTASPIHVHILKALVTAHENILVVGGEDAVRDRGEAEDAAGAIGLFKKLFPKANEIKLTVNHRSSTQIVALADAVSGRSKLTAKTSTPPARPDSSRPRVVRVRDEQAQAKWVVEEIQKSLEKGESLKDIAVLYRAGHETKRLEIELVRRSIPTVKFGGVPFTARAHIQAVLAHLRVVNNPCDHQAWLRILQLRPGIDQDAHRIAEIMVQREYHAGLSKLHLKKTGLSSLEALLGNVRGLRGRPAAAIRAVASYYRSILYHEHEDAPLREKDLTTLGEIASGYKTISALLTALALESPPMPVVHETECDGEDGVLTLSTIEAARGREWNTVFILNATDSTYPGNRENNDADNESQERIEARELLHLACTRAREQLYLMHVETIERGNETVRVKLSGHLKKIPTGVIHRVRAGGKR